MISPMSPLIVKIIISVLFTIKNIRAQIWCSINCLLIGRPMHEGHVRIVALGFVFGFVHINKTRKVRYISLVRNMFTSSGFNIHLYDFRAFERSHCVTNSRHPTWQSLEDFEKHADEPLRLLLLLVVVVLTSPKTYQSCFIVFGFGICLMRMKYATQHKTNFLPMTIFQCYLHFLFVFWICLIFVSLNIGFVWKGKWLFDLRHCYQ